MFLYKTHLKLRSLALRPWRPPCRPTSPHTPSRTPTHRSPSSRPRSPRNSKSRAMCTPRVWGSVAPAPSMRRGLTVHRRSCGTGSCPCRTSTESSPQAESPSRRSCISRRGECCPHPPQYAPWLLRVSQDIHPRVRGLHGHISRSLPSPLFCLDPKLKRAIANPPAQSRPSETARRCCTPSGRSASWR